MTKDEALNVANQCRATASHPLTRNILVDGGSTSLDKLLLAAERAIEVLAQPAQAQEPLEINGLTKAETDASMSVRGLSKPTQKAVAWLVEFENGEQELHFNKPAVGETHTPLYTTPQLLPPLR